MERQEDLSVLSVKELKRRLEKWHLYQAMQKGAAADADADNAF